jgi:hypothetical protein
MGSRRKTAAAEAVAATLKQNPEHLILDLSGLTFMTAAASMPRSDSQSARARTTSVSRWCPDPEPCNASLRSVT